MSNKLNCFLLWLSLSLVALSGLVWWGLTQVPEPTVKSEKSKVEVTANQVHLLGEEGDFVVAPKELKGVSSRYALTRYKESETLSQEEQGNKVVFYDLLQAKMKVVVDLKKEVLTYDDEAATVYFSLWNDGIFQSKGTEFLEVGYFTQEQVDSVGMPEVDKVDLALNMDTLELVPKTVYEGNGDFSNFFSHSFFYEELVKTLATTYQVEGFSDVFLISRHKDQTTTKEEINLFQEYPELKDKLLSGDYYLFVRPDKVRVERQFNTLLYWFAPVGQERVELYATDQKTGEKTLITSYADYQVWAATHTTE